ncbi:unnamed protein product [Rhizophagus irregularis]|nr:unnamed protein product [Rhizophagus irregularis]CAB4438587.1 unnamed protein product [Rhizophagus irregularis]
MNKWNPKQIVNSFNLKGQNKNQSSDKKDPYPLTQDYYNGYQQHEFYPSSSHRSREQHQQQQHQRHLICN